MPRADVDRTCPRPTALARSFVAGFVGLAGMASTHALTCSAPSLDDAPLPEAKFAMATRDCNWPAAATRPAVASDERREAAQLSLYGPAPAEPMRVPSVMSMPRVAPPAPSTRPAPRLRSDQAQRVRTVAPALARAARDFGIDPWLLHAVAHVESRHNPSAHSHAGARGLMQVMPATAKRFGVQQPHQELLDFETNVRVSAEYLKVLQGRFGNNLPLVLAAYNAGEGAVEKYGRKIPPYKETQHYVRAVIDTYLQLRSAAARMLPHAEKVATP